MVVRNIGIEVKPPKTSCSDLLCPYHGKLSVRGRIFEGIVSSARTPRTVSIERDYLHYYPKYSRYERRRSKLLAHNPPCIAADAGERVRVAECRPISKEVGFVVVEKATIGSKLT